MKQDNACICTRTRELVSQYHEKKPKNAYVPIREVSPYVLFGLRTENPAWINRLAATYGVRTLIGAAYHTFRMAGLPYLSSDKHGEGYALVDPNSPKALEMWDKKFRAEERRKKVYKAEGKLDMWLFNKCLENCKRGTQKKRLIAVAVSHGRM